MTKDNNLKILLKDKQDKNDNKYFVGKQEFPGTLDLSKGVAFLIFLSEMCEEEIQIAHLNKENVTFSKFTKQKDRLKIKLDKRIDSFDKPFWIAKIQYNGYLDFSDEAAFLVFTSKEGNEELQIVGTIIDSNAVLQESNVLRIKTKMPEIIRRKTTSYVNENY